MTVRKEVYQLRSIIREAHRIDPAFTLSKIAHNLNIVATILIGPAEAITESTARTRLVAVHELLTYLAHDVEGGASSAALIAHLDALLPARTTRRWNLAGTLLSGSKTRRRPRHPCLDRADLQRLIENAGAGGGYIGVRDRALVTLLTFSGIRISELVMVGWHDLDLVLRPNGSLRRTLAVERGRSAITLPLLPLAAEAVSDLQRAHELLGVALVGPLLRRSAATPSPLGERRVKQILAEACRCAGLPAVELAEIRSGLAWSLLVDGFSEPEVMRILGLRDARSLDRLVAPHRALVAQRRVGEHLDSLL
jgi:integrase